MAYIAIRKRTVIKHKRRVIFLEVVARVPALERSLRFRKILLEFTGRPLITEKFVVLELILFWDAVSEQNWLSHILVRTSLSD